MFRFTVPIFRSTSPYSSIYGPVLVSILLGLLLAACMPPAAVLQSPIQRSNGNKYKATATVIFDEDMAEAASLALAADESATGSSRKPTGRATILRAADSSIETFGTDDSIIVEVGDIITAWEGKTVITFFDGHTTTLTPVTKIKIAALSKESGVETISLHQSIGSSANHVDKSSTNETKFDISTESSIASVRGTDFNVEICGPEQTFYQTFTGSIDIAKEEESVTLDAGYQLLAALGHEMHVVPLPEQPICGDERVLLGYPLNNQFIFTSTLPIYGTAIHDNFDYWKVEYKPLAEVGDNYSFLHQGEEPIVNELLTNVDVSHLANGEYALRLMVVDKTGNYPEPCTVNVHLYPRHINE